MGQNWHANMENKSSGTSRFLPYLLCIGLFLQPTGCVLTSSLPNQSFAAVSTKSSSISGAVEWAASIGAGRSSTPAQSATLHYSSPSSQPPHPPSSSKDELVMVHAIWRHGDRTPVHTFPTDPYQEDAWPQGFGQLTTRGMTEHVRLGQFLRQRYVEQYKLLSLQYRSNEVYITSTDTNRTIQSAMANMVGMWSSNATWGVDYPDIPEWPPTYVPVPIHTYEYRKDPVGSARSAACPRTFELFDLTTKSPEFRALNDSNYELVQRISEYAGTQIALANLWVILEAVLIEKSHGMRPVAWATEIVQQIDEINVQLINFNSGIGLSPVFGIDFKLEIPRVLGGNFLFEIINRMQKKIECLDKQKMMSAGDKPSSLCKWLNPLKYHVHSAHDMTIVALFATLDFNRTNVDRDGFPGYTSCVLIELWRRAEDNTPYIKILYRREKEETMDVTDKISGCTKDCPLEQFAARSLKYKPMPSQETLCHTPLQYRPLDHGTSSSMGPSTTYLPLLLGIVLVGWLDRRLI